MLLSDPHWRAPHLTPTSPHRRLPISSRQSTAANVGLQSTVAEQPHVDCCVPSLPPFRPMTVMKCITKLRCVCDSSFAPSITPSCVLTRRMRGTSVICQKKRATRYPPRENSSATRDGLEPLNISQTLRTWSLPGRNQYLTLGLGWIRPMSGGWKGSEDPGRVCGDVG